jgi:dTDP-4-amino-4,6-dideoxygalactose transaminase
MTDIMASLGLAQFKRYPEILGRRKEIIEKYDALLSQLEVTSMKHYDEKYQSCGHLYLLRLNEKDEAFRNDVITKMAEKGVSSNVHYKPLPMHSAYKNLGFKMEDYPNAFDMYKNEITLPLHTLLTDEDIEYVVGRLKESVYELK